MVWHSRNSCPGNLIRWWDCESCHGSCDIHYLVSIKGKWRLSPNIHFYFKVHFKSLKVWSVELRDPRVHNYSYYKFLLSKVHKPWIVHTLFAKIITIEIRNFIETLYNDITFSYLTMTHPNLFNGSIILHVISFIKHILICIGIFRYLSGWIILYLYRKVSLRYHSRIIYHFLLFLPDKLVTVNYRDGFLYLLN